MHHINSQISSRSYYSSILTRAIVKTTTTKKQPRSKHLAVALLLQSKDAVAEALQLQSKDNVAVALQLQSKVMWPLKAKKLHILIWMWSFFYQVKLVILAYLRIS